MNDDTELDEFLDALPNHLRNKTLQTWHKNTYQTDWVPPPFPEQVRAARRSVAKHTLVLTLLFVVCTPVILAGVLLCATGVLWPVGLILIGLGAAPMSKYISKQIRVPN